MAGTTAPHVESAIAYAKGVTTGRGKNKIAACKFVRLACQRFLDDLEKTTDPEYPYEFNVEAAEHFCTIAEALPHTKGQWAAERDPEARLIVLEPWQCFIYCNLYGWVRRSDGLRRFRFFYGEIPRKNGKSTTAALVGDYMFACDGEHGAEVYSGATTERQAWEVFRPARLMAKNTPAFCEAFGIEVGAKNLSIIENGSRFEPVVGKPGDGASPHCAIIDEYHEHKTEELLETMQTGMGSRAMKSSPLLFVITTAGSDIAGPCYSLRADVIKILEGTVENDRLFAMIYTIDDGDDWSDPKVLAKANPNIDVSVAREYLEAQQREAIDSPRKQNTFKTKHLNVWVHARSPWVNLHKWLALADPELRIEQFAGGKAWAGADVSAKQDLASWAQIFERIDEDGVAHYYVFAQHWLPEDVTTDPDKPHYAGWVNSTDLQITPGNMIDADAIEASIQAAAETHEIADIGFDPWGAYQLMNNLQEGKNGRRLLITDVPMNVKHLSEPMKQIAALIEAGRIHHTGDPILSWCVSNVTCREDANENIFPRKERPENKIDAAVAMIIAMSRLLHREPETESVYKSRGLLVL